MTKKLHFISGCIDFQMVNSHGPDKSTIITFTKTTHTTNNNIHLPTKLDDKYLGQILGSIQ